MLSRLYSWYGKTVVHGAIALIVLLALAGFFLARQGDEETGSVDTATKSVEVRRVDELGSTGSVTGVGTVEAVNEAELMSEVSGRLTSVSVSLGDRVSTGEIIAQTENASERAAVLQAQGSYEAALAGAAQSNTSVDTAGISLSAARNSGINAYRSALTSAEDVIRNTVDFLFSNPTGAIPGFRLSSLGDAVALNNERTALETTLREWSEEVTQNPSPLTAEEALTRAESDLLAIAEFVQKISEAASDEDNDSRSIDETPIATIRTDLTTARTTINSALQSVRDAREDIENAENALRNAEIAGTNAPVSAANAQVKQALGALRAAEAGLARTIVRAPFPGTINSLPVKVGDAVSPGMPIARVANNSALEVTTFIGVDEREFVNVGDTVRIEDKAEAVITKIAPAIDPRTGKIEVKIGVGGITGIQNGDTVRISFDTINSGSENEQLSLPLRSLKVNPEGPVVFTVNNDGTLASHPVTIGPIVGDSVSVEGGITGETEIVTDARGLKEGDRVTVVSAAN